MTVLRTRRRVLKEIAATAGVVAASSGLGSKALAASRRDADVIVVGAGLAGLNTALTLQDAGLSVLLLEGSNRVGGRVMTLDNVPGRPEAGGTEFGAGYARCLSMIDRLGGFPMQKWLDTVELPFALNFDGTLMPMSAWPDSPLNKMVGAERTAGGSLMGPFALSMMYAPRPSPLNGLDSWLLPEATALDISYADYLKSKGASEAALRFISNDVPTADLDRFSALWQHRLFRFQEFMGGIDGLNRIATGASRFPEGIAKLLKREIAFNTQVTAIRADERGVEVRTKGGRTYRAGRVTVAVPLPLLRQIAIEPALPPLQAAAVQEIPYDNMVNVFFAVKEPYWKVDGLPGSMWTNQPMGRMYHFKSDQGEYIWMNVRNPLSPWIKMSDADVMQDATRTLNAARPSTIGRVEAIAVVNWSNYPWTRGHNVYRLPGQIARYGNIVAEPHGRIHFAGDHTAVTMMGMEGAMESGERAAVEILQLA
ncbi:MAG: FAD-dependent oxidoreductase [Gammaproteobacteria bacterium]|jgi:monoamine oxidase|nr:FAD-dependent oxidoreductase [Gammaproteobacteria bacterium]